MTLFEDVRNLKSQTESNSRTVARHEEQITGKGGLQATMDSLSEEVRGLRRALWAAGGGIVVGSVIFSLGLLQATGNL